MLISTAPLGRTDLRVDLVHAWPVLWSFLPALPHQQDALWGTLVRGHQWPAQRRGRCHLPDDLCSKPMGTLGQGTLGGYGRGLKVGKGRGNWALEMLPSSMSPAWLVIAFFYSPGSPSSHGQRKGRRPGPGELGFNSESATTLCGLAEKIVTPQASASSSVKWDQQGPPLEGC